jgi:hypothetical protein
MIGLLIFIVALGFIALPLCMSAGLFWEISVNEEKATPRGAILKTTAIIAGLLILGAVVGSR